MDIEKLELFLEVSTTRNFTEVADRHFTTQSNISKQIISLEKNLNIQLFDRTHRMVRLTEAGRTLLPHAQDVVNRYNAFIELARDLETSGDAVLTVLSIPTLTCYEGFHHIADYFSIHTELTLQLKEVEAVNLLEVFKNELNLLVYTRFFEWHQPNTDVLIMEEDRFVAVVPKAMICKSQSTIELSDLKDENFLLLSDSTLLKQPIIDLCCKAGFTPTINHEGTRVDLLLQMVRKGLGVSILMEKTVNLTMNDTIVALPIFPNRVSYLAFIKKSSKSSGCLLDFWEYLKSDAIYSKME